ncbi:methyl-accepting chemotaxis protein [Campylobacter canadensis]|uniref:Nitrate- and nitrite sensing domain-containing protein n=1 Tax=Campylobacter canadensis TaxID=449520 RepID=A0ABS7WRY3_9BACT|nr:methyl-accepting chemotaxis protein [Campylobacter canadensis]MBZ7986709.1 nitrate- and nitrite sensing domain-containing protein [Campylobacter canadensis]MBZ7994597.1 nitrate- and nitrite sensing domain-containing protein [Campylobacter canadensis]MBZ7996843.1 nitrate- and nitrite sensing domain-containing protein [Campylobacter canadensis]MBZ7997745.1 nitrate- and nitrite sensing domain-containing protein [Campylobacter canadensis]MBZ7999928.1 nitrate- and nitrite sensing domain-containi
MRLTISRKLFLLIFVFLVILLIYNLALINKSYKTYKDTKAVENKVSLIDKNNELIHLVQAERGMSTALKSAQDVKNLNEHRLKVKEFASDSELAKIAEIRKIVDSKQSAKQIIQAYTDFIAFKLNENALILDDISSLFAKNSQELKTILSTKEYFGQLRGTLNGVFAKDEVDIQTFASVVYLHKNTQSLIKHLKDSADMKGILNSNSYKKLEEYINIFLNNNINNNFNVDNKDFFINASDVINQFKTYANNELSIIINLAKEEESAAKNSMLIQIIIAIFVQGINMLLAYIITKNIVNNLKKIELGLNSFFDFLSHKTKNIEAIVITSNDEFKSMADKINKTCESLEKNYIQDKESISEITQISMQIKSGNLNCTLYKEPNNPGIKELKNILNQMLSELQKLVGKDINKIENLLLEYSNMNFSNKINDANGKVEHSLNKLCDEIRKMLLSQSKLSDELKINSNILQDNMQELKKGSKLARDNINHSSDLISKITHSIEESNTKSKQIISQSEEIVNITNIIKDISQDIALLALNATIEAASAGEHGRGFAVVAEEVSRLANSTEQSLNLIDANVKMLVGQIYDIDKIINEQNKDINIINEQVKTIDNLSQNNDLIAQNTDERANAVDSLANNITQDLARTKF